MADSGNGEISREDLISEIRAVQDDLEALGVKRERIQFDKFDEPELLEISKSFREQLKRRKEFLKL